MRTTSVRARFRTNLDEAQDAVYWMNRKLGEAPAEGMLPSVGELIIFEANPSEGRKGPFALEVVGAHWQFSEGGFWVKQCELHIPRMHHAKSIAEWTTWFRRHVLGREW